MKKLILLLVTFIFSAVLMGFSSQPVNKEEVYKRSLTYSNLSDSSSQNEVRKTMKSVGITPKATNTFFENVNSFNRTIKKKSLTKEGFITIGSLEPKYDQFAMQEMWEAKNPLFIGYNCRIISFDLMKDMISIGRIDTKGSDFLSFDKYALENSPKKIFNKAEQRKFFTLFSPIQTLKTKDINVHVKKVKEDWKKKKVEFPKMNKTSMISVFFHDEGGYLFIGHAGVLIPTKDGKLLFLEKLAFQEPYQAVKFKNRTELNDYLMNKYDTSWNQPTAKPFIMENDKLLKGYRGNPNNPEEK